MSDLFVHAGLLGPAREVIAEGAALLRGWALADETGLLAALDWRAVFWINVPIGIYGTAWAYFKLRVRKPDQRLRIFFVRQHRTSVHARGISAVVACRGDRLLKRLRARASKDETDIAPGFFFFQAVE